jgi:TRAP-type C4-dicarboxylate transport system permease small subunit
MSAAEGDARALSEGIVERICKWVSEICLVGMVVLTGAEMVARGGFDFSFETVDEVGGYLLVALTFFSLSVCQASNGFHRVEFFLARLSQRGKLAAFMAFGLLNLVFAVVLDIYLVRLVLQSYEQEAQAMTALLTPLWIPQAAMPLGLTALCFTLLRTLLRDFRAWREAR